MAKKKGGAKKMKIVKSGKPRKIAGRVRQVYKGGKGALFIYGKGKKKRYLKSIKK